MPKNNITDLRDHLFATIEALQDEENPMDVERAKAIVTVGKAIIDTAKVELRHMEITGELTGQVTELKSEFLTPKQKALPEPGKVEPSVRRRRA